MDAQSLHEHQESTPRQRLGVKSSANPVVEIAGNDDIEPVKNNPERPEESMPEIEVVEVIEPVVDKEPAPEMEPISDEEESEPEELDDSNEEYEDDRPNPWTPEAIEERRQSYHFTSTSIPKQTHRASVEPAKPVRDNANAIILILLIAILLITVATYAVILAREEKAPTNIAPTTTSEEKDDNGEYDNLTPASSAIKESFGVWRYKKGGCFVFSEKGYFYWYQSCSNVSDNYHYGTLMGTRGSQALYELNMTYDDAVAVMELDAGKITTEGFYSLILDTTETSNAGVKRTAHLSKFKMLFAYVSNSDAIIYDTETEDEVYYLEKISDKPEEWRKSMASSSNPDMSSKK